MCNSIGFDFDQTIADSAEGIQGCLNVVCERLSIASDISQLRSLSVSGLPLKDILTQIVPLSLVELASQVFMEMYPSIGLYGTTLFPHVKELFEYLRKENYKIYVLSAKSSQNLALSLKHLELSVECAIGGLDFEGKVRWIQELDLQIYVGDQVSDMEAASKAGCKGILISRNISDNPLHGARSRFDSITSFYKSLDRNLDIQFNH